MSVELAGLASSFTALNAITKTMIGLHDAKQLNAKIVDFQNAMIQANSHVMAVQQTYSLLASRVRELEKENARLKDWSAEKTNYELREVARGVFAYIEKGFVGRPESAQKLCCNCFDQSIKSLLQQTSVRVGRTFILTCPRCKSEMPFPFYTMNANAPPDGPLPLAN